MNDIDQRISKITQTIRALRVLRWSREWPQGHADRPQAPAWVKAWEREHGTAPASAERFLEEQT
jgi:hypothetical protein